MSTTDYARKMGTQHAQQGQGPMNTQTWNSQAREAYNAAYNKSK